ncbi:carbohydrate kinase family protein [Fodinibius halophilus]|uniref:Carbohydrate kinase family protein n=1 Tax=Fodinibius halophilus TaxID=1736908 RepID=A0A6M1TAW2_9BACT|nr:carbohydrate kinase family protein [Fodinibius halophilus]NGP89171.1 carbohydrate kinase family protein [Fodinibius halophilus]
MGKTDTSPLDILVIGELNMDLILNDLEEFPQLGKEKIANDFNLTMGSSSAIFAANCSRLEQTVGFCGMVGDDDFGKQIRDQLLAFGVDVRHISISKTHKTGITAVLRYDDDRAMVTYPGAMEHFSLAQIDPDAFENARHLHISSLFLQPGIKTDLFDIIERAQSRGMTTSIDPQWDPKEQWDIDFTKLVGRIDFFLPNEDEFLSITESSTVKEGINEIRPHLGDGTIIIKQGTEGATFVSSNEVKKIPGYTNDTPVDTVGAGDSFDAGFICQILNDTSIEDSIRFGNITGAVSTTEAGGTRAIQSRKHVQEIAKKKFSIDDFTG